MDQNKQNLVLRRYLWLSYGAIFIHVLVMILDSSALSWIKGVFVLGSALMHSFMYMVAFLIPSVFIFLSMKTLRYPRWSKPLAVKVFYATSVVSLAGVHLLLYLDKLVYGLYGFHLDNSFVLTLVSTKDGWDSMEIEGSAFITLALMALSVVALQGCVWLASYLISKKRSASLITARWGIACFILLFFSVAQSLAYGVSTFFYEPAILNTADRIPFYVGMTMKTFLEKHGFESAGQEDLKAKYGREKINYPLQPIQVSEQPKYNVVFLVAESLRWDMLTPEIMPNTWNFGQKSIYCQNHYSAGHDTRSAIFGLFYSLYTPYWDNFKNERTSPVLMDVLLDKNYQMLIHTSSNFGSPAFNRTVFSRVPEEMLHEGSYQKEKWAEDAAHIDAILEGLNQRKLDDPFFVYMFFESPHATYFFPPEAAIRDNYIKSVNYLRTDFDGDRELIKNRYINACHYLDSQIERVLKYLQDNQLLDNTIVVITGDHGEEFMEHGRWGHGSEYHEEVIRVPMVMSIPGKKGRTLTDMTSHLDIAPTLLNVLGVKNPTSDYALGINLFADQQRKDTIVGGWSDIAYIHPDYKIIIPTGKSKRFKRFYMTDADDQLIKHPSEQLSHQYQKTCLELLDKLSRFYFTSKDSANPKA